MRRSRDSLPLGLALQRPRRSSPSGKPRAAVQRCQPQVPPEAHPDLLELRGKRQVPRLSPYLLLPRHVTDVHRALGQLCHHEDGSDTLPLCVGHDGEVGWPRLEVLGAGRVVRDRAEPEPSRTLTAAGPLRAGPKPGVSASCLLPPAHPPTSIHWATLSSRNSEKVSLR